MKLHPSLITPSPLAKYLGMGIFILMPFVAFVFGMRYQERMDLLERQLQEQNITVNRYPTPTLPQPTAQTYANTAYGFSFSYPGDFQLLPNSESDLSLFHMDFKTQTTEQFSVEVRKATTLADEVTYRRWQINGHTGGFVDEGIAIEKDGIQGKKLTYTNTNPPDKQYIIVLIKKPYAYTIQAETALADQILASFQFLPTAQTSTQQVCIQVISYAKNPTTDQCETFATPCDVPVGWKGCQP